MNVYICKGVYTHIRAEITWLFFSPLSLLYNVVVRLMKFACNTKLDDLAPMLDDKPALYRILSFVLMTGKVIRVRHGKCCEPLNCSFVGLSRWTTVKS